MPTCARPPRGETSWRRYGRRGPPRTVSRRPIQLHGPTFPSRLARSATLGTSFLHPSLPAPTAHAPPPPQYGAFRRYQRQGLDAFLTGRHGTDLSEHDLAACLTLQRDNMGDDAGNFDEATSRKALLHDESRVLLMHATQPGAATSATQLSPTMATGGAHEAADGEEWDFVEEFDHPLPGRSLPPPAVDPSTLAIVPPHDEGSTPDLIGFLHLQFCVSEATPLLCVLNMQLSHAATGKGLGKFALQLVELMARQLGMELVMIYLKDGKVTTMRLNKQNKVPAAPSDAKSPRGASPVVDDFELVKRPPTVMLQQGRPVPVRC